MDDMTSSDKRLLQAVKDGNNEIAKYMVQTIKRQGGMGFELHDKCCFLAIENGFIPILKLVFNKEHLEISDEGIKEFSNSVFMSRVLDTESVEGVDFLLSQGLKLLTIAFHPWSAFIYCVEHDKKNILKHIMTLPQMQYPKYQLSFAAMTRNASILKKSLEYPELLSEIDKSYDIGGNTFPPICLCLYVNLSNQRTNQELDCVKLLIETGADIKSCTMAITVAARSYDIETIMYLLDQGVGLDAYNLTETLITLCGMLGRDVALTLKCIQRLIEAGADPHLPNDEGETPLSASIGKKREVFDYILDLNLDKRYIDVRCGRMKIPILTSIIFTYSSDLELIEKILKTGCEVNLCDFESNTPLMYASGRLDLNVVKLLLDYGADMNACNNQGKNAGNFSLEFNDDSCNNGLKLMFEFCLELNDDSCNNEGNNKGNYGEGLQKLSVLKMLMDRGMTLDNEYNLLFSAFEIFDLECIEFLLKTDIEKDFIGYLDQNILHLAANTNTRLPLHVYLMLSEKVKNINQKDQSGRTPLSWAVCIGNYDLVQLLLDDGCDVNTMDNCGESALSQIAERNHIEFTKVLLKAGARPEELLKNRLSWLGINDCLTLVLENGGDVLLDIPDGWGNHIIARSLYDCHNKGGQWTVYNILTYNPSLNNLFLKGIDPPPIFRDEDYFDILDLLYQSGAPKSELVKNSSDDVVGLVEQRIGDYTLMSRCRRIIRQKLGLGIKEKVKKLSLPESLRNFLLLKDIIHECYFQLE